MSDDALIAAVREHARRINQRVEPVAHAVDLDEAERRLGFGLPALYRRLLLEVGNGGFGPGPLYGMPPDGYFDDDLRTRGVGNLVDLYLRERMDPEDPTPRGLLYLANWGAGKWSHLDCATGEGAVLTSEWLGASEDADGLAYWLTSPRLADWLREWTQRSEAHADMTVDIVGREVRKNPFTGLPREYAVTRPRGPRVDLGHVPLDVESEQRRT